MWHQNKHLSERERLLTRNSNMADLLLEIKREHAELFEGHGEVNTIVVRSLSNKTSIVTSGEIQSMARGHRHRFSHCANGWRS